MTCYSIDGVIPVISPHAYVHPTAVLIGDVIIEDGVYVGPLASLRADFGRIHVQANANIQDACVIHGFPNSITQVAKRAHVGHGAILHGCTLHHNVLIGMHSVILDGAVIGENTIVGAHSLVKTKMQVPANVMLVGSPAKVIRELTEAEKNWKQQGTQTYIELAQRCLHSMQEVQPHAQIHSHRRDYHDFFSQHVTKHEYLTKRP